MTFPTAHSTIYRNEDGEVLGWDTDYGYEPDYDPYAESDYRAEDDEPPEPKDRAQCISWGDHGELGEGTDDPDIYECGLCHGRYRRDANGNIEDLD